MSDEKDYVNIGVEAIYKYLEYIGINSIDYRVVTEATPIYSIGQISPMYHAPNLTYVEFSGTCDFNVLEYVKPFIHHYDLIRKTIFNEEYLYSPLSSSKKDSIYKYLEYANIRFRVGLTSKEEIDDFIYRLKYSTEKLRYKRFNEEMDKQISEELSTKD